MSNTITWSPLLFSNPIPNSNTREELEMIRRQAEKAEEVGVIEGTQNFMAFVSDIKERGLSHALYDKPFSQVIGEFLKECAHDLGIFILGNGDFFFLMPAIIFMVGTFVVGKNKFTKWIVPLWFAYFVSRAFFRMIM